MSMKVRLESPNNLCRFIVSSESDGEKEYIVDLCVHQRGVDADGIPIFNGACVETHDMHSGEFFEYGCRDYVYRCEPRLKKDTSIHRCKHLRAADEYALKLIKAHQAQNRKDLEEHHYGFA